MFIGRKQELYVIQDKINSNAFEFGLIYGRRRVGKTALLKEVLQKNKGIYYVASEMDYLYNIEKLSEVIAAFYDESISFNNLEMLFNYLKKKSEKERVVFIIDEFTYLFAKEPGIQSVLQTIIDGLKGTNIILILSGSQVGMIEKVISYKKPLYGRATFKIKILPFDYYDSSKFYSNFSNEDKIRAYAIFGGIPYYLTMIDDKLSLKDNVIDLIISESGVLRNEVEFFLRQELRSISTYSMIINAISSGATRLNEISTKSQINNTGNTTSHLNTLRGLEIIEKEICFGENVNSKKTLYKIKDNFFNFIYTFIRWNKSSLLLLESNQFYGKFIEPKLDLYVSFVFEKVCQEFLIRKNKQNFDNPFIEIGRYWGANKELKREVEIDIITKDNLGLIVYECKWTSDIFSNREARDLKTDSSILKPLKYGAFSKMGFSNKAKTDLDITFILDDLF